MNKNQLFDCIQELVETHLNELQIILDEKIDNYNDKSILKTSKRIALDNTKYNLLRELLILIYDEMDI